MLSEKPWRTETVLLLASGLMLCLCLGALTTLLLPAPSGPAQRAAHDFQRLLVSVVSFHGGALVLVHGFLKLHGVSWRTLLGLDAPHRLRAVGWAVACFAIALPAALVLNHVSAWALTALHEAPEEQATVRMFVQFRDLAQRVFLAGMAVVLAPVVEETLFRGILYPFLKQLGFPGLAVTVTSLLFAAIHYNLMTFLPLLFLAMLLVWLYEITDRLFAPILAHALFNAANLLMLLMTQQ